MRIFGDAPDSPFDRLATEPGLLYGKNDVLTEEPHEVGPTLILTQRCWVKRREEIPRRVIANKLYLHIPTNAWTRFTGLVREYLLPWRWKSVYLQREEGGSLDRVLVYKDDQVMSGKCKKILGLPLFDTHLINQSRSCYTSPSGSRWVSKFLFDLTADQSQMTQDKRKPSAETAIH